MEIYNKLKEYIEGSLFTTVINDTLVVHIYPLRGLKYKYEYKGLSYEIIGNEINTDKIVRIIVNDYKDFIMKRFFRR